MQHSGKVSVTSDNRTGNYSSPRAELESTAGSLARSPGDSGSLVTMWRVRLYPHCWRKGTCHFVIVCGSPK